MNDLSEHCVSIDISKSLVIAKGYWCLGSNAKEVFPYRGAICDRTKSRT